MVFKNSVSLAKIQLSISKKYCLTTFVKSQPPQKRLRPVQKLLGDLVVFGFVVANRIDLAVFEFEDISFGHGHDDGAMCGNDKLTILCFGFLTDEGNEGKLSLR
mgnify:CR=1 FL=1